MIQRNHFPDSRISSFLVIAQAKARDDANGRFDLETGIAYAKMLRNYPFIKRAPLGRRRELAVGLGNCEEMRNCEGKVP